MTTHGRCMCGDVEFTVEGPLRDVCNCHCHRCRQWSGHYWAATAAPPEAITFLADSGLSWYSPADGVEYGFCSRCGSSLFWRIGAREGLWSLSAGCLDQPTGLRTEVQIWMHEHGDYHPSLPDITEHEYD